MVTRWSRAKTATVGCSLAAILLLGFLIITKRTNPYDVLTVEAIPKFLQVSVSFICVDYLWWSLAPSEAPPPLSLSVYSNQKSW